MQYGGLYDFRNCTSANYWRYDNRTTPSVLASNYYDDESSHTRYVWPMQGAMTDCIVYGSLSSELNVSLDSTSSVSFTLTHCLVKGGEWDEDPLFVDPAEGDYHLQEDSPAHGIGYTYPEGDTLSRTSRMNRNKSAVANMFRQGQPLVARSPRIKVKTKK